MDPHPLPENVNPGFQPQDNNMLENAEEEDEGWEDGGHWAFPQQQAQNDLQQQEEKALMNEDPPCAWWQ